MGISRKTNSRRTTSALELNIHAEIGRAYVPFLRKHLIAAHAAAPTHLRELSVALVGDRRMGDLHEQFLAIAGPTDVLTFSLDEDDAGHCVAGEVVICVPEARRQAKPRGIAVECEILLYGVHGLLHLSGHDDRTRAGYRKMHALEDAILSLLEIGPVFAANPAKKAILKLR